MPKKTQDQDSTETPVTVTVVADEVLVPFNVIIDGQDRTVFATDLADLELRVAKMRGQ